MRTTIIGTLLAGCSLWGCQNENVGDHDSPRKRDKAALSGLSLADPSPNFEPLKFAQAVQPDHAIKAQIAIDLTDIALEGKLSKIYEQLRSMFELRRAYTESEIQRLVANEKDEIKRKELQENLKEKPFQVLDPKFLNFDWIADNGVLEVGISPASLPYQGGNFSLVHTKGSPLGDRHYISPPEEEDVMFRFTFEGIQQVAINLEVSDTGVSLKRSDILISDDEVASIAEHDKSLMVMKSHYEGLRGQRFELIKLRQQPVQKGATEKEVEAAAAAIATAQVKLATMVESAEVYLACLGVKECQKTALSLDEEEDITSRVAKSHEVVARFQDAYASALMDSYHHFEFPIAGLTAHLEKQPDYEFSSYIFKTSEGDLMTSESIHGLRDSRILKIEFMNLRPDEEDKPRTHLLSNYYRILLDAEGTLHLFLHKTKMRDMWVKKVPVDNRYLELVFGPPSEVHAYDLGKGYRLAKTPVILNVSND